MQEMGENRSSSVLCTRAALRRPGILPCILHKEGYSRMSLSRLGPVDGDGLEQPRHSKFRTPYEAYSRGEFSEPSMSQVLQ